MKRRDKGMVTQRTVKERVAEKLCTVPQRENPCGKMTYFQGDLVCGDCFIYPCPILGEKGDEATGDVKDLISWLDSKGGR